MKKKIQVFLKYKFLLTNLIERDIKVKYRRSVLGIMWSVLNPLLMMLVIWAVFSKVFRFNVPNYHLYYLTGALIYNFISEATSTAMSSVFTSGNLIKKVYIPKYIFPLEKTMFAFVNMLFSLVAVIIVILATMIIKNETIISWTFVLVIIPMMYALVFAVGLSLFLSALCVFFRDIMHLYAVFLTAWMYATPIIYPSESISNLPNVLQALMVINPMYHFVNYTRNVVLYGTVPDLKSNLICIACAVLMLLIGVITFKKKQDKFVLYM